MTSMKLPF